MGTNTRFSRNKRIERFLERVDKTDSCWLWRGAIGKNGYGYVGIDGRKVISTHQFMYMVVLGKTLLPGFQLRHTCDVRHCVRPDHLMVGTQKDNIADAMSRKRHVLAGFVKKKLDEEKIAQIRLMFLDGMRNAEIARRFGVSNSLISLIRSRKRWQKV